MAAADRFLTEVAMPTQETDHATLEQVPDWLS
jgi:hypothetical protein